MGWFSGDKKRKMLIIDDEVSLRTMIGMFFKEQGFEILEASSGDHGIQVAEEKSPDIILLDIMMPGMSGVDALRYLRDGRGQLELLSLSVLINLCMTPAFSLLPLLVEQGGGGAAPGC